MSAHTDVAGYPASIFTGWAPHVMLRAHIGGLHQAHNLAARARRQLAGIEAKSACADRRSLYINWCASMAQIGLYRAAIAKAKGSAA